ncbi:Nucleolar pre-ribosomal-associated protein 1 [Fulvia fulva]|uniref:Nucleolar pre-ribosomal-associated protein 1 n=1 Tax=Passalora fulva TaxID=5499 RepID=A0A9Q8PEH7_PASFU|nr:Nucleolar pre-ribosomal-associated protein 1 [Fulvia fulva]KAK4617638.1 Nucleolar pre-ribosomal-associated protein 1 [Fulvia fulva]KAK4618371.1 Nucleolar pre-ribosomal-associated protein 1 [Fulvia fulva]UJO20974.1 Nucleolar pre-ribosomal-associated protein 1 [Fulvia fulva]WPV17793.1 Nucleolar pre-ribosomal-associated protein 1 [Fulvia fulva]WPV32743.1 Nucleolar pre-ribosomal-associated protein 1 [Fulvia fulva]
MSKRERQQDEDDRPPKRPRPDHQPVQTQEVTFARQLQDFLVFRQDGIQQLRNGIASFKLFLESILYHKEEDNRGRQISILREYLEKQKPADATDLEHPFLSQLWQAWSFANQNNHDSLASSVSAALALLLKTLSGILDLREHGLLLCRTVLQNQHLRLVKRCLDAPKHKDFVISPSLRLLTEVVSFDGGVSARELYKRREQTFDTRTLRRLLSLVKLDFPEDEARRKPAVRTLALRYVLALFKYLHEGGKADVLKDKPLCGALFQHIQDDPAELVTDLLSTIEQNVLRDEAIPRSAKASLLTSRNLERITTIASQAPEEHQAADRAFDWLRSVCTTPKYGILRHSGWYPPGTTTSAVSKSSTSIDLGLDSLEFYDREEAINLRNTTLLSWTSTLHAHNNERERGLLLACFTAAPELVAPYFGEKTMQLDPKLSNTWVGYASLMFEVVALPVPEHLGAGDDWADLPPQTAIVLESLIPRPLTQKILVRCLNQNHDLVAFFATRILILALEKVQVVIKDIGRHPNGGHQNIWNEALERLVQRFAERCPSIKDVIAAFRQLADDDEHIMQREAITRLLGLYYQVLPQQALEEQFDVSVALTAALARSEAHDEVQSETSELRSVELINLLNIARLSTGMKWFNKQGGLAHTPIVTLLRIHARNTRDARVRELLQHILVENDVLNSFSDGGRASPLDALVASFTNFVENSTVWEFLDESLQRAVRKPVKYLDDLIALSPGKQDASVDGRPDTPSLLTAVILEQASFVVAKIDAEGESRIAWAELFLQLLRQTTDESKALDKLTKAVNKTPGWKPPKSKIDLTALLEKVVLGKDAADAEVEQLPADDSHVVPQLSFSTLPSEPTRHPELTRWNQKDLDMAIEDGDISALFLDLCSSESDIRRQALTQLIKLKLQLRSDSTYGNSAQLSLLVGEVAETFEQHYLPSNTALPYIAGTFAVRVLQVQIQPQHFMYPKVNRFLIRGPEWRVGKLPGYWLSTTTLSLPEEDDAYWKEVQWVLDWILDGLRTTADLDILRRGDVFEKVLALWHSPGAIPHKNVRERISELVNRAACLPGGSDVLVTRTGALSWLDIAAQLGETRSGSLRSLVKQTSSQERLSTWAAVEV